MLPSYLLSRNIHVPYDDAAITAAGDELAGVWGIAQTLNSITAQKTQGKAGALQLHRYWEIKNIYRKRKSFQLEIQVNKSNIQQRFLSSYLCPCSSMAVPLRPPMSHMMMELSELPEKSTLWTGSQQSAVTLPRGTGVSGKHSSKKRWIQKQAETLRTSERSWPPAVIRTPGTHFKIKMASHLNFKPI